MNPADDKQRLRRALRGRRQALSATERRRAALAVAAHARGHPRFARARRVAVYLDLGSEMPTAPLIQALCRRGVAVFVPVLWRGGLRFRRLDGGPLRCHAHGMRQPLAGPLLPASAMDVVVLPLLAFDARGTRLGQGGGYYDRTLARTAPRPYRLGLAYAMQQVGLLPRQPWDIALQAILTERGLRRFPLATSVSEPCATG